MWKTLRVYTQSHSHYDDDYDLYFYISKTPLRGLKDWDKLKAYGVEKNASADYKEWLKKEIWWQIDRKIDFYFDEEGNCHFENERYLIDETLNPSVNFHSNRPREMINAN